MAQRVGLCLMVIISLLSVACAPQDPTPQNNLSGPPLQVTAESNPRHDQYITITVEQVTLNRAGESAPNEVAEFRMVLVGADGGEESTGVYCPADGPRRLEVGQTFDHPCRLTFDEKTVGDVYYLLFLGVDQDEVSFAQDLGYSIGVEVLATGLVRAARAMAGAASGPSGGAALAGELLLEQIVSLAGEQIVERLQWRDVIGRQVLVLRRSGNWGVDQDVSYLSNDGGLRVTFHISRTASPVPADGAQVIQVSLDASDAPPPQPTPAPPTPAPPTPIPQFIDRLVLFAPGRGEVMTLHDGATVDLSAAGTTFLDVTAEVYSSQVGSVGFLLDGRPFDVHGRSVENASPYIMGGDLSGEPYGDWDWSGLIGNHTIGAYACTHANGEGVCSAVVTYRIVVQR